MATKKRDRVLIGREEQFEATGFRQHIAADDECEHDEQPLWVRKANKTRRLPTRTRDMTFVSLHHHSTFSYLDGYQLPGAHVRRATEIGMRGVAMTEHGNVSSHVQLEKAALKEGVRPIFGVELYTGQLGEKAQQKKNHLTVLAETQDGYHNLLQLVSRTYSEGFHYHPTADWSMLNDHRKGLVILSGCQGSLLFTSLVGGKLIAPSEASYRRGKSVARRFKAAFGDGYYLEVQAFPTLEETNRANPLIAQISRELEIPLVASLDCHYTIPTEKEIQVVLHAVRSGKLTLEEQARDWGYKENLCPPMNDASLIRKLMATGLTRKEAIKAVLNSEEIYERCQVALPSLPMVRWRLEDKYLRMENGRIQYWRDMIEEGWRYRRCGNLPSSAQRRYRERLEIEMKVIEDKDFIDYFLVVGDAVRWAKDHDVAVGPARGSAAASLICWLLRITEVDPVKYPDLVFERFIDITRQDLPDIDLDFDSETRYKVREYLVSKYGEECVSNIGTFTGYKAKNSLDDVGRVMRVPPWKIELIKDVLIERSSGDLRASATIEDTVLQFDSAREVFEEHPDLGMAMDLEGNYRGFGVHAAGLVVSTGPIQDVAAVYEREVKGDLVQVVSMDKYDAETKGLLKLDFLGLANMTMLNHCRQELGWSLDDLYNIDLEDAETLKGFQENDVIGVFQFEGRAMRYVCGALRPDSFKECVDVNALARPGPLHNGSVNEYIDIKHGNKEPSERHPALDKITGSTYYQIVYQEQILRILGEIGNFDWTHRAEVRKIISRKIGEQEFNRRRQQFIDGAHELHPDMSDNLIEEIWGQCITAGSYAFNNAHAVAYTMIGWATMYFKRHYPDLFYAETLRIRSGRDDKISILVRDAARHGVKVLPPDPVNSDMSWNRDHGNVYAGLTQVKGIGPKVATKIIEWRAEQNGNPVTWDSMIDVNGIGPKKLTEIKNFVETDDPFNALWLDRSIQDVKDQIKKGQLRGLPMPTHTSADLPYFRSDDIPVVWIGSVQTRNVRDLFEINRARTGVELKPEEVRDPDLREWMVMVCDDETDQLIIRCDRWKYPRFKAALWKIDLGKDLLLVRGVKPGWATRQISIHDLWVLQV